MGLQNFKDFSNQKPIPSIWEIARLNSRTYKVSMESLVSGNAFTGQVKIVFGRLLTPRTLFNKD